MQQKKLTEKKNNGYAFESDTGVQGRTIDNPIPPQIKYPYKFVVGGTVEWIRTRRTQNGYTDVVNHQHTGLQRGLEP